MFDVITFGSATLDIFIKPKEYKIISGNNFLTGRGIGFNLGSKIDIKDLHFFSGGGGTNTAAGFAKLGFKTAYCGMVGKDIVGEYIIDELRRLGVVTDFISQTDKKPNNISVILNASKEDRTILVFRGGSELFSKEEIPLARLNEAKWFYLAPLSGKLANVFEFLVNFANENKIKIAANPGNTQLKMPLGKLKEIIAKIDILILNQEEASLLTKIPYQKEKEIFKKLDKICPNLVVMTKGQKGIVASDGKYLYSAGILPVKVADRTGAGDSLASGFVSGFIRSNGDIEYALQLGIANSALCLTEWGSKNGLLKKGDSFKKIAVKKQLI